MAVTTPLSWWKMDESSGNATDQVGSLSAVSTSVTYGAGKLNNCAIYNGSAYHTVSDASGIKPTSDISFGGWVYITSTSSYQMLLAKGENAGDTRSYELRCFGSTTQMEIQMKVAGNYVVARSTTAIGTGTWAHVIYTRTGTTHKIYINGTLETLASSTPQSGSIDYSTDALWFGQRNGGLRFNGKLDEIGIWNVALTQSEVTELYNGGTGISYPFATNVTVSPSVQTATFTIPAYTTTAIRNITISPSAQSATFSIPTYTAKVDVSISPTVQSATFSIPTYQVLIADVIVSPSSQSATFSIPTYTPSVTANPTVTPSVQVLTFSIPTYTSTTTANITILASVFTATFLIPTYTVLGDYWEDKFDAVSTSWSDKDAPVATSWNNKY